MAVGVPEEEVYAAADAVLARGERPTVERVRLELGRGSPARVGALLDQWWDRLAQRLRGETRLPALPSEVSEAFVAVWRHAIGLAQAVAEQTLEQQRQLLAQERLQLAEAEDQARREVAGARQQVNAAESARRSVETRLTDLERLLEERQAQIDDLHAQREALQQGQALAAQQVQQMQAALDTARLQAEEARLTQEAYVRGLEERAHREVDRAREESKARAAELKEARLQLADLQQRQAAILVQMTEAQQQAVIAQGQAAQAREERLQRVMEAEHAQTALQARLSQAQEALEAARREAAVQHARADTLQAQFSQLSERLARRKPASPRSGG
ncbi:DNA-binding protein [Pseudomonas massiliensis]|uniref:DNA-binding protein n=1 Tax=Pseudomonas massiliensis TaxID=522492 RepID=UPI00058BA6FE|nr:DNA-binding protein [Pseudomonas massiliensis]